MRARGILLLVLCVTCFLVGVALCSQPQCLTPQVANTAPDSSIGDEQRTNMAPGLLSDETVETEGGTFLAKALLEIGLKYNKFPSSSCGLSGATIQGLYNSGVSSPSTWGNVAYQLQVTRDGKDQSCAGMGFLNNYVRASAAQNYFYNNRLSLVLQNADGLFTLSQQNAIDLRTVTRNTFKTMAQELSNVLLTSYIDVCRNAFTLTAAERSACVSTYTSYANALTAATPCNGLQIPVNTRLFDTYKVEEVFRFCTAYRSVNAKLNSFGALSLTTINTNMLNFLSFAEDIKPYLVAYSLEETIPFQVRLAYLIGPSLDALIQAMLDQPTNVSLNRPIGYYTPGQPCQLCQIPCETYFGPCAFKYFNYGCSSTAACFSELTASVTQKDDARTICRNRCSCANA